MRKALWVRIAIVIAFAVLLEILCRSGVIGPLTLLAPSLMVLSMLHLLTVPDTYSAIGWTVSNVVMAVAFSIIVGMAFAAYAHRHARLRAAIDPYLASYYAIPFFVLYPIFVSMFGLNRWPLVLIGIVFAMPAMVSAVLDGLDGVPPVIDKLARVHRLGKNQATVLLVIPSILPAIFTGIKLCVAYSFIGIIVGEFILSDRGLGFEISFAYTRFQGQKMYGLMLVTLLIVILANMAVRGIEKRLRRRWERA